MIVVLMIWPAIVAMACAAAVPWFLLDRVAVADNELIKPFLVGLTISLGCYIILMFLLYGRLFGTSFRTPVICMLFVYTTAFAIECSRLRALNEAERPPR